MDEHKSQMELLFNKAENYFKTSIELYKLKLISSLTELIAELISCFVFYIFLFMGILFSSIALAFWLGNHFCSKSIGFLIVAIIYVLMGMLISVLKNKWISNPIRKKIIVHILKSTTIE